MLPSKATRYIIEVDSSSFFAYPRRNIPFETRTKFGTPVFHSKSKKEPLVPFLGTSSAQLGPARHVGQRCRRCHRCCCCCCCRPAAGPILRLKFWRKKISTTFSLKRIRFLSFRLVRLECCAAAKKKLEKRPQLLLSLLLLLSLGLGRFPRKKTKIFALCETRHLWRRPKVAPELNRLHSGNVRNGRKTSGFAISLLFVYSVRL